MSLSSLLDDPVKRDVIIEDALGEVAAEVAGLGGLKGRLVQVGYQGVQRLRPGFLESNLERLLPRFAVVLDPHVVAGNDAGDVSAHFVEHADTIADDLLQVTDKRANVSTNRAATSLYARLRADARDRVIDAMPRIGDFVARHTADA